MGYYFLIASIYSRRFYEKIMLLIVANKRDIFVINVDFSDQIVIITITTYEYFFLRWFYFRLLISSFSFGVKCSTSGI